MSSKAQLFYEAALAASEDLRPVQLGGVIGTVYVRPMSGQESDEYSQRIKNFSDDEPLSHRQAKALIYGARDEHGALIFAQEDVRSAVDKLILLPFETLQLFGKEWARVNGWSKDEADEKPKNA